MATVTVQASGNGSPAQWDFNTVGANEWTAVNGPDDDDTSYIVSRAVTGNTHRFTCTPTGIQVGDTITQISLRARAKRNAAGACDFKMGYSFTPNGGGTQSGTSGNFAPTSSSTYDTFTYDHTGLSVVWGSALTFFVEVATLSTRNRLTTLEVTITYTPAGGLRQTAVFGHELAEGMFNNVIKL